MELILVRHAEPASGSEWLEGTRSRADLGPEDGARGPGLTAAGHVQAEAVANWLLREPIDRVLSSPARRAMETAEAVARLAPCDIETDPRLRDAGEDAARYRPIELDRRDDPEAYRKRMEAYRSGTRLSSIDARVNGALDDWCARSAGQRVVAFCHGSVINVFAARVLGLASPAFLEPAYASAHRFRISRAGVRSVRSLNETAFLPDA